MTVSSSLRVVDPRRAGPALPTASLRSRAEQSNPDLGRAVRSGNSRGAGFRRRRCRLCQRDSSRGGRRGGDRGGGGSCQRARGRDPGSHGRHSLVVEPWSLGLELAATRTWDRVAAGSSIFMGRFSRIRWQGALPRGRAARRKLARRSPVGDARPVTGRSRSGRCGTEGASPGRSSEHVDLPADCRPRPTTRVGRPRTPSSGTRLRNSARRASRVLGRVRGGKQRVRPTRLVRAGTHSGPHRRPTSGSRASRLRRRACRAPAPRDRKPEPFGERRKREGSGVSHESDRLASVEVPVHTNPVCGRRSSNPFAEESFIRG